MDNTTQPDTSDVSIRTLCETYKINIASVGKTWNRRQESHPDIFGKFNYDLVPTAEQVALIPLLANAQGMKAAKAPKGKAKAAPVTEAARQPRQEAQTKKVEVEEKKPRVPLTWKQKLGLYLIMAGTAVASVQNMAVVTGNLLNEHWSSVVVTALFSLSPFVFSLCNLVSGPVKWLVFGMVGFEWFCNLTRVYGGLINFETPQQGLPTRFLGLVTDIFNSGTHPTALALAGLMAAFLAGLFLLSLFGLKHGK